MTERERDQALLATLGASGRARLEAMVEAFVRAELPDPTPEWLCIIADMFEDSGIEQVSPHREVGLCFAAALRERAAGLQAEMLRSANGKGRRFRRSCSRT